MYRLYRRFLLDLQVRHKHSVDKIFHISSNVNNNINNNKNDNNNNNNNNNNSQQKLTDIEKLSCFDSSSVAVLEQVKNSMQIIPDFISENEEQVLLDEIEHILKRIRYEQSHWDDAIHNYRETEHNRWREENIAIIERVKQTAFCMPNVRHLKYVHILDIANDGFIKPHVDSVRVSEMS